MVGEVLYFLHRHFRVAAPLVLIGGVGLMAGMVRWIGSF
ncbi:hypothetical protein GGR13_003100 [Brevundimonas variabilis]|uniref:Uncharacterized protein n=1 Tax=Brevundimonas variabilis TaxID=74312 RepID=A0A7W9CKT9_9CAUL|nr:hypothetical protein [Brevundimonas variabilis]